MTARHALITGGAGFIGSHLADTLLARGFEVSVLDNLTPQVHADAELDAEGWPVYLHPAARRIRGDVLDGDLLERSLRGVTHLAHLAASVGVGQSMINIVDYTRNNALGTAVLLETLSRGKHGVELIAVASSMSIYGEGEYLRLSDGALVAPEMRPAEQLARRQWELVDGEETLVPAPTRESKPLKPTSIYAINKRDHEEMCLVVGRALGIPTLALRLFNVYGSRQALSNPYTGVAAIFIARLLNDQPPLVFEDGGQLRDFVHVKDVAGAFAAALESDTPVWDAVNVGSGHAVSVAGIAETLARLLGKNIAPDILQRFRIGDVRHCTADNAKLARLLGFTPRHSFEDGMAELIDWVRTARVPVDRSAATLVELEATHLLV